ncbi:MAG: 4'-phosphopantetheinyl transferase family protein [Solirubrobacteraceae bacterium]
MTRWLTRTLAEVPAGEQWLGPSERAALSRLRIEKRRADWRLGRYAAKAAVGAFLGVQPGRIEVVTVRGGAPIAQLDGVRAKVELSLSHRAGRALAALASPGTPVGCDLELVEPRSAAFVEQWLAPAERALVRCARTGEQAWLANLIWSAKEAAAKARGEGLRLDVRCAEVTLGEPAGGAGAWRPLRVDWGEGLSQRAHGWFRREPGWVMTVVGGDAGSPPRMLSEQRLAVAPA